MNITAVSVDQETMNRVLHPKSVDFNAHQLAAIRRAILTVIDDQKYELYEGRRVEPGEVVVSISEDDANEARMKFCDEVQTTLSEMVWERNSECEAK